MRVSFDEPTKQEPDKLRYWDGRESKPSSLQQGRKCPFCKDYWLNLRRHLQKHGRCFSSTQLIEEILGKNLTRIEGCYSCYQRKDPDELIDGSECLKCFAKRMEEKHPKIGIF